jgi:hypothetical protein
MTLFEPQVGEHNMMVQREFQKVGHHHGDRAGRRIPRIGSLGNGSLHMGLPALCLICSSAIWENM